MKNTATTYMEPVNVILFNRDEVDKILRILNVKKKGYRILDETSEQITCHTCGREITTGNLGNVMPGTKEFFCDNPACFAMYLSEKKVKPF